MLQRSKDIIEKINEIIGLEKKNLENKIKDLEEVLEPSAISKLKDHNKRLLNHKQTELLEMILAIFKLYYRKQLEIVEDTGFILVKLNLLSQLEKDLAYNISAQNFCDVVFLKLKNYS